MAMAMTKLTMITECAEPWNKDEGDVVEQKRSFKFVSRERTNRALKRSTITIFRFNQFPKFTIYLTNKPNSRYKSIENSKRET